MVFLNQRSQFFTAPQAPESPAHRDQLWPAAAAWPPTRYAKLEGLDNP